MNAPLVSATQRYLDYLRVARRYSPATLHHYGRDLAALVRYAGGLGIAAWRDLHGEQVRSFVSAQHRRGLSPKSLQRLLSVCRSFFRFLAREGELKANPAEGVRAPKAPRKLPQVLDTDEAARLLAIPADTPLATRDRAMLELFYSSGLRLAELTGLVWRDLDLAEGSARVTGKGSKTRIVPVGRLACAALAAWRTEDAAATADMPVFRGRDGRPLSGDAVRRRLRHWAREQGIWKRVYPHLLRHSCASHVLESSGDLRGVQELLGHADIGTTQIYTHLDFQRLARVYDAAHPRARRRRDGDT